MSLAESPPAYLNIYDLDRRLTPVNSITLTLGLGGFFHVGLEVFGREICFSGGIVLRHSPRDSSPHVYRQSVDLGAVNFSVSEFSDIVDRLETEFPSYHLLTNNCIHFVTALAKELQLKAIPRRFFLITDSLGFVSALARGRRPVANRRSCLRLRPRFGSPALYKKPTKFEFSLALDRRNTLTYSLPDEADFLLTGNPADCSDSEANVIGIPEGFRGRARLTIDKGTILLNDLTKNISISLHVSQPFLLDSVICTLHPMHPSPSLTS